MIEHAAAPVERREEHGAEEGAAPLCDEHAGHAAEQREQRALGEKLREEPRA